MAQRRLGLYAPHDKQLQFHESPHRFKVVCFGRQAGKSTAANNELLKRAWENPGQVLWYISPTYDSARIMFRRACHALNLNPEIMEDNKSELMITIANGSRIFYKSGEVLENLRSETLNGVVIDEVRNQHKDLWPMVIRPMLTTTGGWAAFISTPNGFDHFYDLYLHAQSDTSGRWLAMKAPSTCNPLISEEELQDAKATMSDNEFAQEYMAEFVDLTAGRAYINFAMERNVIDKNPFVRGPEIVHPQLPILLAMDFNITPMAWCLGQKKVDDFYFFDEIWLKGSHTQEAAELLAQKIIALNHQKTGVIICGDATAKASQRAAAGQSDYDILCQILDSHKITWRNMTPDSNPTVKDRVNTVNAKLKDANGQTHLWFHPNCKETIKDFQRVVWKQGSGAAILDQTTDKERTHASDGPGYAIHALSPLVYNKGSAKMSIIPSAGI